MLVSNENQTHLRNVNGKKISLHHEIKLQSDGLQYLFIIHSYHMFNLVECKVYRCKRCRRSPRNHNLICMARKMCRSVGPEIELRSKKKTSMLICHTLLSNSGNRSPIHYNCVVFIGTACIN